MTYDDLTPDIVKFHVEYNAIVLAVARSVKFSSRPCSCSWNGLNRINIHEKKQQHTNQELNTKSCITVNHG